MKLAAAPTSKSDISCHDVMFYEIRRLLAAACYLSKLNTMEFIHLHSDVQFVLNRGCALCTMFGLLHITRSYTYEMCNSFMHSVLFCIIMYSVYVL